MGKLIAAMATSHAFAMVDPSEWDDFRNRNRQVYQRRFGIAPPVARQIEAETSETNHARYTRVRDAHAALAHQIHELKPDVLLLVGDDQNEHFHEENIPQVAIYTGGDFSTSPSGKPFRSDPTTANLLLSRLVNDGFDVSIVGRFADDRLISHAHVHVLKLLDSERQIPIVPIFVNGIHVPAIEPYRCHALGVALRKVVEIDLPSGTRVAVVGSGGLSHFTAGYPWRDYRGPFRYGDISVDFDRFLIKAMAEGQGEKLASDITSNDLLDHGDIEFRCWLVVLGMVGAKPIEMLAYEPFYSAIMGMGIGRWSLD